MISSQKVVDTSRFILNQESFSDSTFLQQMLKSVMEKHFWNTRLLLPNQGCLQTINRCIFIFIHSSQLQAIPVDGGAGTACLVFFLLGVFHYVDWGK